MGEMESQTVEQLQDRCNSLFKMCELVCDDDQTIHDDEYQSHNMDASNMELVPHDTVNLLLADLGRSEGPTTVRRRLGIEPQAFGCIMLAGAVLTGFFLRRFLRRSKPTEAEDICMA